MSESSLKPITELIGVYNANGGLTGELAYVTGKLFGTAHCALCDITHGWVSEKSAFKECKTSLDRPLKTLHINEQEADLAAFTANQTPCVVGRTEDGFVMLLDAEALEACHKSVDAFRAALDKALA